MTEATKCIYDATMERLRVRNSRITCTASKKILGDIRQRVYCENAGVYDRSKDNGTASCGSRHVGFDRDNKRVEWDE